MNTQKRYSPEFRERSVRLIDEQMKGGKSQWAAIQSIAQKLGCTPESLRCWTRRAEVDEGNHPGLTTEERDRLKVLERENRELRRANKILKTASAFLPRRSSTAD